MANEHIPRPENKEPGVRTIESMQRTALADDRTLLAWYRTSFGAYALAVGLGGIVPEVSKTASSAYRVLGVIFAILGAVAALGGVWHHVAFREHTGSTRLNRISVGFIVGIGLLVALLGLAMAIVIALGG
jgi:uncharacterized membrane protein YidH (DUF202 family)